MDSCPIFCTRTTLHYQHDSCNSYEWYIQPAITVTDAITGEVRPWRKGDGPAECRLVASLDSNGVFHNQAIDDLSAQVAALKEQIQQLTQQVHTLSSH